MHSNRKCCCQCAGPIRLRTETAPDRVLAIRQRVKRAMWFRLRYHFALDWEQRWERDYGRRARPHLIPDWQKLPYCDA